MGGEPSTERSSTSWTKVPMTLSANEARAAALALLATLTLSACGSGGRRPPPFGSPDDGSFEAPAYRAYVASESSDLVHRILYRPDEGASVEKEIEVGVMPGDLDGAHGLSVSPDGRFWYLTTAHGTPFGRLWKYRTGTDEVVESVELGLFPATIGVRPDGSEAYVANFNLHGDPEPSTVSVVRLEPVVAETGRIPTCVRPHGSRVGPDGRFQYSVCGPEDRLVEISIREKSVSRTLDLPAATEGGSCGPSWAEPGAEGRRVFVACNGASEVLEVDRDSWSVTRRLVTGSAPYNLEATPDGRLLLATAKAESALSVVDLAEGREVARLPTSRALPPGVVPTAHGRYAFVSN
jgi:DNA-binding beta-propeller fold protein YncE